jgi:NAD(P)-dependent dehydrogenase (short-subunit alcohol dehydrogenase family)
MPNWLRVQVLALYHSSTVGKAKLRNMQASIFQDNVVIITGASLGIGRELAFQLADQKAWLALASRNAENLAEVSNQCRQRGGRAISVPTDVADQSQCQNLIEATVVEYGQIDTLINNAAVGQDARFDQLQDLVIFEKVIRVNLFGSVFVYTLCITLSDEQPAPGVYF